MSAISRSDEWLSDSIRGVLACDTALSLMYSSSEKPVGPADLQERPLAALDFGAGLGQPRGDLVRNQADAVLVGVDQVAGVDLDARRS